MPEHADSLSARRRPGRIDARPAYGVLVRLWPNGTVSLYRHSWHVRDYTTADGVLSAVARYRAENESLCAADAWRGDRTEGHYRCAFPLAPNGTCYAADHHHPEEAATS